MLFVNGFLFAVMGTALCEWLALFTDAATCMDGTHREGYVQLDLTTRAISHNSLYIHLFRFVHTLYSQSLLEPLLSLEALVVDSSSP